MNNAPLPPSVEPAPAPSKPRSRVTSAPETLPEALETERPSESEPKPPETPPGAVEQAEPVLVEPPPTAAPYAHLPERFGLKFRLLLGSEGFDVGEVGHVWHRDGDRYSIVASAQATGLAVLFLSGRYHQSSHGVITPAGLRPEAFTMQRKDRRFQAHFDWDRGRLDFGSRYGTAALVEGTQDILSIAYQLALFPRPVNGSALTVTHGKRVQEYVYRELGEAELVLPSGKVMAMHLRLSKGETDEIDIWLRREPPHVPLKINVADGKRGESGVLVVEELPY